MLLLIDPLDQLCTAGRCNYVRDGQTLFAREHFAPDGAVLVAADLVRQLAALPNKAAVLN